MSLTLRPLPPSPQHQVAPGGSLGEQPPEESSSCSVMVNYGIHRGCFPIAGMRIRDARQVLVQLMNIDPSAVAVVNGNPVTDENEIIGEDVRVLHFVKPSSIKGGG
jgi:hypothetical protein